MSALRLLTPLVLLWFGAHRVLGRELSLGAMLGLNAIEPTAWRVPDRSG